MDNILDDLAKRWDYLNSAQKSALAQTVGGVRQYNNLISLMDNYERFQELVTGARGSEGYLQNQADEYAESWEAAKDRLAAAWQGIYDQIIDDKFIIKLTDFLTFLVDTIGDVIEGLGGLKGVIPFIINLVTTFKPEQTAVGISKVVQELHNFKAALDGTQQALNIESQNKALSYLQGRWDTLGLPDEELYALYDGLDKLAEAYRKINELRAEGRTQEATALAESAERYRFLLEHTAQLKVSLHELTEEQERFNEAEIANKNLTGLMSAYNKLVDANGVGKRALMNAGRDVINNLDKYGIDKDSALGQQLSAIKIKAAKDVEAIFTALEEAMKTEAARVRENIQPVLDNNTTAVESNTAAKKENAEINKEVQQTSDAVEQETSEGTSALQEATDAQKAYNEAKEKEIDINERVQGQRDAVAKSEDNLNKNNPGALPTQKTPA
jgi:hypothetical protein